MRVRDDEALAVRVERRQMRAGADRERKRRLRPIKKDARCALLVSGLEKVACGVFSRMRVQHGEHRADGQVDLDVGGAVERVERDQIGAVGLQGRHVLALFGCEGGDRTIREGARERLVGEDVEQLLSVAVGIDADGLMQFPAERPATNAIRNLGRRRGQRRDQMRESRLRLIGEKTNGDRPLACPSASPPAACRLVYIFLRYSLSPIRKLN